MPTPSHPPPPFCLPPGWCRLFPAVPIFMGCSVSSNATGAGLPRVGSLQGVDLELTPLLWTDGPSFLAPPAGEGKNCTFPNRGSACPSYPFFLFWTLHW